MVSLGPNELTYSGWDTIAAILQVSYSNSFSCMKIVISHILIQISLKFGPKGSIDNKPALIQVTAWRQTTIQIN